MNQRKPDTENGFSWNQFRALPFELRNAVELFWEAGYDYDSQEFWECYDPEPTAEFVKAVQMYDWLMNNND